MVASRTHWEYRAEILWNRVGDAADKMNDTGDASGLLNARGAEGWEFVCVVPQPDSTHPSVVNYVAYFKRPSEDSG